MNERTMVATSDAAPTRPKSPVTVRPITNDDVLRVARFLHEQLGPSIPAERFAVAMRSRWQTDPPNHGVLAESGGEIVGVYVALYRRRVIDGEAHEMCNLAAWCVLENYRLHSVRMLKALLAQPGYDFVDLSPSGNVIALNRRLGFTDLDTTTVVVPALPWPGRLSGVRISSDAAAIRATLSAPEREIYDDHCDAPAARHVVITRGREHCYVIFRRDRRKGLPVFASILYASNPGLLRRTMRPLAGWLLAHHAVLAVLAETRIVGSPMPWSWRLASPRPKMFKSATLGPGSIDYLYSELVALEW